MQQERGGGGQQQQDRRLKLLQPPENQQQPQQPQKCPRCESLNTKFCYYNNYSLTQPRYFCKGCRRYWTQGGTLRNVPVGGGCRKGKRPKKPSPSTEKPSQEQDQNQHLLQLQLPNSNTTSTSLYTKRENDNSITSSSIFYPSGGFLSSSGVNQPFNQQPINFMSGGDFMGSNLALLQGFSLPPLNPLHQLQHQQIQQSQLLQQSSSNASYWSNNNGGSSLNSSQLPDLSGYGIPPHPHPHPHPHQPPSSSFL